MIKIVTVIGARPQFVKAAVVSRAIRAYNAQKKKPEIQEIIVHTGQHYDVNMSDIFFEELDIPKANFNLNVKASRHGEMTAEMLKGIEALLIQEKPDVVLVYGDTNSTLSGSLAAVKLHIPVAHVEAGIRSFNMAMAEEMNRILVDRLASYLFCPTVVAENNLNAELQYQADKVASPPCIENTGDVMFDAALYYAKLAKPSQLTQHIFDTFPEGYYLSTVHRAENTNDPQRLFSIVSSLESIAQKTPVVLPLHPRTKKIMSEQGLSFKHVTLLEPTGYFDMLKLLRHCKAVLTDSGGMQKEAYFFEKPCITLRDDTEWVDLVNLGANILVGADTDKIIKAEASLSELRIDWSKPFFGDGFSGKKIVEFLAQHVGQS